MKRALAPHQAPQKTESQMDHCKRTEETEVKTRASASRPRGFPEESAYPVESSSPDLGSSLEGLISSVVEDSRDPEELGDRGKEEVVGQLRLLREVERKSAAENDFAGRLERGRGPTPRMGTMKRIHREMIDLVSSCRRRRRRWVERRRRRSAAAVLSIFELEKQGEKRTK